MPIYGLDTWELPLAIPNGPRPREGGRGHFPGRRLEEPIIAGLRGGVCHRAIRFECRVNTASAAVSA